MGREVRRVPATWNHPRKADHYVPLHGGSYSAAAARWDEERAKWDEGLCDDFAGGWKKRSEVTLADCSFEEWSGGRPVEADYMPDWPDAERTHLQMYETCSEGTPISPVMESPEALAHWLADTKASAFAGVGATYDQWLATIKRGWAPSAYSDGGGLKPGVSS